MKTIVFTLFLQLVVLNVYSQPTNTQVTDYNSDYNRARRDVQKEYEAQADRNRQPNSPYVGHKGLSAQEKIDLQVWWDNITGKPSAEEKAAHDAKRAEGSKKYREQEAIFRKKISDELELNRQVAKPHKDRMLQLGIVDQDAEKISIQYAQQVNGSYGDYGTGTRFITEELENAGNLLAYFYQNYETADFNTLKLCIDKLNELGATITSNKLTNLLMAKFPEREADLESIQIEKFKSFFANPGIVYSNDEYGKGDFKTMIEDYFSYEAKHPNINTIIVQKTREGLLDLDAYDMMEKYCSYFTEDKKEIKAEREKSEELIIQELKIKARNGFPNSTANPYKMLLEKNLSSSSLMRRRYHDNQTGHVYIGSGNSGSQDFGVNIFDNGTIYYGGHGKYGTPKGKGMFFYKSGTYYEGEFDTKSSWTNPVKKGEGKITFTNSYYMVANFKNNIPENAQYYNASGAKITKEEFESVCNMNDAIHSL